LQGCCGTNNKAAMIEAQIVLPFFIHLDFSKAEEQND
jgi:hypothetical protein